MCHTYFKPVQCQFKIQLKTSFVKQNARHWNGDKLFNAVTQIVTRLHNNNLFIQLMKKFLLLQSRMLHYHVHKLLYYCCDGVRLCICGNGPLMGPLCIRQMIHEWIWNILEMILTGNIERLGETLASVPLCLTHIPQGLLLSRRASAVRSQ
jgi:hypothetical protein